VALRCAQVLGCGRELPPVRGAAELHRVATTETAIRRLIARLDEPAGLVVCLESGAGGSDLLAAAAVNVGGHLAQAGASASSRAPGRA
jgi:hypothetical protein